MRYLLLVFGVIVVAHPFIARAAGGWTAGSALIYQFGLPRGMIGNIIGSIAFWLLTVLGFISTIAFLISGFQYLLAAGDEKRIETAKTSMKWSIVGVLVALSGVVIIQAVHFMLNASGYF